MRPTRRVEPDGSFRTEIIATIHQRLPMRTDGSIARDGMKRRRGFHRGSAAVRPSSSIRARDKKKSATRSSRIPAARSGRSAKSQTANANYLSPLRALYFGGKTSEPFALLHADQGGDSDG